MSSSHCIILSVICLVYDHKLHLMVTLQSWSLENVEYLFMAITLRSTLIWSDGTCKGLI